MGCPLLLFPILIRPGPFCRAPGCGTAPPGLTFSHSADTLIDRLLHGRVIISCPSYSPHTHTHTHTVIYSQIPTLFLIHPLIPTYKQRYIVKHTQTHSNTPTQIPPQNHMINVHTVRHRHTRMHTLPSPDPLRWVYMSRYTHKHTMQSHRYATQQLNNLCGLAYTFQ